MVSTQLLFRKQKIIIACKELDTRASEYVSAANTGIDTWLWEELG